LAEKTGKPPNELIGEALDDIEEVLGKEDLQELSQAEIIRKLLEYFEDE